jgi:hypothetical protein
MSQIQESARIIADVWKDRYPVSTPPAATPESSFGFNPRAGSTLRLVADGAAEHADVFAYGAIEVAVAGDSRLAFTVGARFQVGDQQMPWYKCIYQWHLDKGRFNAIGGLDARFLPEPLRRLRIQVIDRGTGVTACDRQVLMPPNVAIGINARVRAAMDANQGRDWIRKTRELVARQSFPGDLRYCAIGLCESMGE